VNPNGHALTPAAAASMAAMPSLEEQTIDACLSEVKAVLAKYGCELVYQEVTQNGVRVSGSFSVIKPNHRR
jgi:hypothetical protein